MIALLSLKDINNRFRADIDARIKVILDSTKTSIAVLDTAPIAEQGL